MVYGAAHVVTIQRVTDGVHQALRPYVGSDEHIRVRISSFPIFRLFSGVVDTLDVELTMPRIGDTQLLVLTVEGKNVQFDLDQLQQGALSVRSAQHLDMSAHMSEGELNNIVTALLPDINDVRVELKPGTVTLEGNVPFLGQEVDVSVQGEVVIVDRTALRFIPTNIAVEQRSLPPALVELLQHMVQWTFDVTHFPFPVQLDAVHVQRGMIRLDGSWHGTP